MPITPPIPEATPQPAADSVQWFGASARLVGGRPDTRYGWLADPDDIGHACIVKAVAIDLAAHAATLLSHEREVLRRLHEGGAPVPVPRGCRRDDWLVTRFAGPSLAMLAGVHVEGEPVLTVEESIAAWASVLARAAALDDAGALPLDLRPANVALPLARGLAGQPLLHAPVLVDHAHTVVAGLNLRRPVWIDRNMPQVAPELRAALTHDEEALIAVFRRAGAALPGQDAADDSALDRSRRLWAAYDAPQAVQRLVDSGGIDRGAAMQYAVGMALRPMVRLASPALAAPLSAVVRRLCAVEPAARFASLLAAASALRALLPAVPLAAVHALPAVDGMWLAQAWTRTAAAVAPAGRSITPSGFAPPRRDEPTGHTRAQPTLPALSRAAALTAPACALATDAAMPAVSDGSGARSAPGTGTAAAVVGRRGWLLAVAAGAVAGVLVRRPR